MNDEDDLLFSDDEDELDLSSEECLPPWRILIVDDEPEIHNVTKLALDDFSFLGRALEYLHAYSGKEAREVLAREDDIAIVLLDVVMETDHEGLDVVKYIREELDNHLLRIILRTGQPGQAPALKVIKEYDINDYKEKSELTAEKLICAVYTGLSAYRDLRALAANKRGLEKVIEASASIFETRSVNKFAQGVLEQLAALLFMDQDTLITRASGVATEVQETELTVIAGTGHYEATVGKEAHEAFDPVTVERIEAAIKEKRSIIGKDYFAGYYHTGMGNQEVVYVGGTDPLSIPDGKLVEMFCKNVALAQHNLELNQEVEESQREVVLVLSEAIEQRSKETGNHVRRVGEFARLLGQLYGLPEEEVETLAMAAPLHDAGKIGIPDAILNKPGRHDDEEREIMKTHAQIGEQILDKYERPILKAASILCGQHHEKWDGTGYPRGLKGEDIHIYGRITALADIFDALASERCYKEPWPIDKVLNYLREERGKTFDPQLIDLFLDNLDQVEAIRNKYRDSMEAA